MEKKEFKAESKRLLDLMINSIYTNKEIFLRELISNASDALDKLHYLALTNDAISGKKEDLVINIDIDEKKRTLIISDNGCGMSVEELENNLGTIARSGSLSFKEENKDQNDINIIGQFGVGFYSAFMVSDVVTVYSKKYDSNDGYAWKSSGVDGYTITPCEKLSFGTTIELHLKDDNEDEKYSEFLTEYKIRSIVKKYSDYINYPIKMEVTNQKLKEGSDQEYETVKEVVTLNSMIPLWKKNKSKITEEEYTNFYSDKYFDYEKPLKVIHSSVEGQCSYNVLMYIPSHAPYDFYTKEYEKGLQLYSNGVLIMDKCGELLPDYFSFMRGLVDSSDLSLNISRETLQQDKNLKIIAKNIETKIKNELENMLKNNRDDYNKFFEKFGMQIKFGIYNNYGIDKDKLKDLVMFYSSDDKKYITLNEYVSKMKKKQEVIYYACGESIAKIDMLPQVETVKDKKYEILYLTEYVDEFVIQTLREFDNKKFVNVCAENVDLSTKEEKATINKTNEENKSVLDIMKDGLNGEVEAVRFTNKLKNHSVCLSNEGDISIEMEKVINAMPTGEKVKAKTILEINSNHPIAEKLKKMEKKQDELKKYAKVLYAEARMIEGLSVENPTEISNLISEIMAR